MTDTTIIFATTSRVRDENGVWQKAKTTRREVFAEVESVSRDEFFSGGQNGLKPQLRFRVFHAEYCGETECEYNGETYSIYRTYREAGDYIELYVEKKVGVHGA